MAENLRREAGGSSGFIQILVVVAIIQTGDYHSKPYRGNKALRTVVEKASLSSAIVQGLVDPKCRAYELIWLYLTKKPNMRKANMQTFIYIVVGCIY